MSSNRPSNAACSSRVPGVRGVLNPEVPCVYMCLKEDASEAWPESARPGVGECGVNLPEVEAMGSPDLGPSGSMCA